MTTTSTLARLVRRPRSALAVAVVLGAGALGQPALADAAPAPVADAPVTSAALLQLEDIRATGLRADSAELGIRGDQLLGDAGRFDEGCLGEKTMRNITGVKDYPAPGAKGYADGVWQSTLDKDVWVNESVTQGRTTADTDRYEKILRDEIRIVTDCEEDPAQGHHYGPAHRIKVGTATATYFYDHNFEGPVDGGGVAVVRDGNRIGFVSLMFGAHNSTATLKTLATSAAANLR